MYSWISTSFWTIRSWIGKEGPLGARGVAEFLERVGVHPERLAICASIGVAGHGLSAMSMRSFITTYIGGEGPMQEEWWRPRR